MRDCAVLRGDGGQGGSTTTGQFSNVYYGKCSKNRSFNVYMFLPLQNDLYFVEPYKMVNSTPEAHAIDQTL